METVNQDNATNNEEAKFTQADIDRIVQDRLSREREKYGDYNDLKAKAAKLDEIEEASKSELQKATERATALQNELDAMKTAEKVRTMRSEVAKRTGVPAELLTGDNQEDCEKQAKQILEFSRPSTYPNVRDGGEAGASGNMSTRDVFAEWFNNNN